MTTEEAVRPALAPHSRSGLAYLDVMALWNHHVFLGEQVLDSILGDDVLYLKKGGGKAGAEALNRELSEEDRAGAQGHPA